MFKVIFVIIGTLIGAGFASGREIYTFFFQYGINGIVGIIVSCSIFSFLIYKTFYLMKVYEIKDYKKLLEIVNWKYEKINQIINLIINLFLLISFFIMVAGFSGYLKQAFNINTYISSLIFVFICYVVFKKNTDGVIKINELIVPILIFLIIFLGIKNIPIFTQKICEIQPINTKKMPCLIAGILYASYNSIVLIPILTGIGKYVEDRNKNLIISVISGIIIFVLAIAIYIILLRGDYFISQLDMPLLFILKEYGLIYKYIYGFIIITAIFTSAISAGFGFLENVAINKKMHDNLILIMCVGAVLISKIGFASLVENLYPLFGVLGIIQIYLILKHRII